MNWTAYIIAGAGVVVVAIVVWLVLRHRRPADDALSCYIRGLNMLLRDDETRALEYLTRAVRQDTQNVDAYLKLAEIFRHRGDGARALRIARELLVRSKLGREEREEILGSQARSHEALGQWERAAETWRSLVELDGSNVSYQQALVRALEKGGEWAAALAAGSRLAKLQGEEGKRRLALAHAWYADRMFREGEEKEGKSQLKKALRVDPDCPAALLLRADRAVASGKIKEAAEDWSLVVRRRPEWGEMALERMELAHYEQGTFERVPEFLREVLQENPENVRARIHLAELYHRKGESEEGIRLCREGLDLEPSEADARRLRVLLVAIYREQGRHGEAWEEVDRSGCLEAVSGKRYSCSSCGSESMEFDWYCSGCGEWGTLVDAGPPARKTTAILSPPVV